MINHVYTCILKDGSKRIVLQPYIAYDDDESYATVKNAIRGDGDIRAIAMQERISLHKLCDIVDDEENHFTVIPFDFEVIGDNEYFRRYAQSVIADEARQKANVMEATNDG